MFCTKCGFQLDDDANFCAKCGSSVKKITNIDNRNDFQNQNNNLVNNFFNMGSNESTQNSEVESNMAVEKLAADTGTTEESVVDSVAALDKKGVDDFRNENEVISNITNDNIVPENAVYDSYTLENFAGKSTENSNSNSGYVPQNVYAKTKIKKKFSVVRFIFSMIILVGSIFAACMIFTPYVKIGVKMSTNIIGDSYGRSETADGIDIIKDESEVSDINFFENGNDLKDHYDIFRILVIAFEISIVVFALIDLIFLTIIRKRKVYVFTMLFALIRTAIGGAAAFVWSSLILDDVKELLLNSFMNNSLSCTLEMMPAWGLITALAIQAVTVVSAIVLICTKNK